MRAKQYILLFISLGLLVYQTYLYFEPGREKIPFNLISTDRSIYYKFGYLITLFWSLILAIIILFSIHKPMIKWLKR